MNSPRQQRNRRVFRTMVGIYVAGLVVGFGVGYAVSSGPVLHRVGFGVVGVFVAMVALWFVVMLTNVIRGTHAALSHPKAPPS